VLRQYYGYLRRNPNDAPDGDFGGWKFWLDKLNQFNGNFIHRDGQRIPRLAGVQAALRQPLRHPKSLFE
jgi:hypothetical protein